MRPGDVFWIDDAAVGVKHLHVVLTHPEQVGDDVLVAVVNVSTIRTRRFDATTILEPGSHPRIHHRSYVRYQDADFESVARIEDEADYADRVEPLRPALFETIFAEVVGGRAPENVCRYCSDRVAANGGVLIINPPN